MLIKFFKFITNMIICPGIILKSRCLNKPEFEYLSKDEIEFIYLQALKNIEKQILSIHINRLANPRDYKQEEMEYARVSLIRVEKEYFEWKRKINNV